MNTCENALNRLKEDVQELEWKSTIVMASLEILLSWLHNRPGTPNLIAWLVSTTPAPNPKITIVNAKTMTGESGQNSKEEGHRYPKSEPADGMHGLADRGWSQHRIARVLGINRETGIYASLEVQDLAYRPSVAWPRSRLDRSATLTMERIEPLPRPVNLRAILNWKKRAVLNSTLNGRF